MSAPLRKMAPQFTRLGTKFVSARNFGSKVDRATEVSKERREKLAFGAIGVTFGVSIALLTQKMMYGRVINILGFPIGRDRPLRTPKQNV
ncbi:hypothetical protein MKW98_009532 [Papaver atlanticum]|uniref:Uncharacterized protein n=1 Tax=Papaver atlanticum TaxID=357466 RepID=A0AAD4SIN5_9MAGN|nr:hypothetical protein MKW98_009532 [Papaver atlanticum]